MMLSGKTRGLALLGLVALGLRVGVVLALAQQHRAPLAYEHGEIAENLLAGRGFRVTFLGHEGLTSQQAPLYPAMLAVVYRLFGTGTPQAILAMQLWQSLAGTALVLTVPWLAWSLVPRHSGVGWLAGWGAALYPTHVYMVTHIQVVTWATLCLTLLAAVLASPHWRGRWRGAMLAGLLSGILLLLDPILCVTLPIAAAWFLLPARGGLAQHDVVAGLPTEPLSPTGGLAEVHETFGRPRGTGQETRPHLDETRHQQKMVAAMAGVALLLVAPWLWRNYCVHGELVFIKSSFGYAFWQGNNPASWGTDKVPKPSAELLRRQHDGSLAGQDRALWEARHETVYIDDLLLRPHGYREFAGLSEPERSRLLGRRAWQFVCEEPARYLHLCGQRLRYFLLFDETNPKASHPLYRLTTVTWLMLSAAGLWSARRHWRALAPLVAMFAAVALFHTLTIVSARFRIPVEPLTFIWAAMLFPRNRTATPLLPLATQRNHAVPFLWRRAVVLGDEDGEEVFDLVGGGHVVQSLDGGVPVAVEEGG